MMKITQVSKLVPFLLASLLFVLTVFTVLSFPVTTTAQEPGCYTGAVNRGESVITSTPCPDDDEILNGVTEDKCYLDTGSGFNETACSVLRGSVTSSGGEGTFTSFSLNCESGETAVDGECVGLDCEETPLNRDNCAIIGYIVIGINFLSAVAGIVIIGSIMIAGYQYMTARDNPQTVQAARMRVVWSLLAVALFVFMYALLEFLVPGGVLPG